MAYATALNTISEASAGWQKAYADNPSTATPIKPGGPWQVGTKAE